MQSQVAKDRWIPVGLDDDGSSVFIDQESVRTHGVRPDRVDVNVIVQPAQGSESLQALQKLLSTAGKSPQDAAYVEQSWVLDLPKKQFSTSRFTIIRGDSLPVHSLHLNGEEPRSIEPGSSADRVSQAVEKLVQDRNLLPSDEVGQDAPSGLRF